MKMTGNTILITGGTSGIGRALAESFHAKGNKVIVTGRRQQLLDEVEQKNPGIVGMRFDAGDKNAVAGFADEVKTRFPQLNVLINNAGMAQREDYTSASLDTSIALETLQVNVGSVIQLSAALLPTLRAQPEATLMVTTSGLAFTPFTPSPTYSATKAFLHNWLEALRMQLRNTSVEVLELVPPYVQTELGGPEQANDPRAMPLADFNREVIQLLEENKTEKGEILVENVRAFRWAEKTGQYDQFLEMFANF